MGDALPCAFPNLGPDFFPAIYGGEIIFEASTSYIKPFLNDWADADGLKLSGENPYWEKMEELYAAYIEAGKNTFYTGWPDLHPGADCLVGFRGPQNLAIDLFDDPDAVKKELKKVTADFFKTYEHYYKKLSSAGQACTGWPGIVSTRRWHVPSNDFSYMISPEQFNEFFLEGLREECNYFDASIYHLDGVGSLRHLDRLLEIKTLNAIQWVWGAGRGEVTDWIGVFKKVQAAGKGVQLFHVYPQHLDVLIENLRPEGVWMGVCGIESEEHGAAVLKKINRWK
ncbi:MAG: trimethylamine corrinoid protein 2 [Kiritimatiellaceae bacterium]|nr:trimethylamine corrinoid protein 2 [Kiritimatiellaceae bacterium]